MKKLLVILGLFLLVVPVFTSCSDDDDDKKLSNQFVYEGSKIDIAKAKIINFGFDKEEEFYRTVLLLATKDVSMVYHADDDEFSVEKPGLLLYFTFYTDVAKQIESDEYVYEIDEDDENDKGLIYLDTEEGSIEVTERIKSGKFNVVKTGNHYSMEFNFVTIDGEQLKGCYDGAIEASDLSSM